MERLLAIFTSISLLSSQEWRDKLAHPEKSVLGIFHVFNPLLSLSPPLLIQAESTSHLPRTSSPFPASKIDLPISLFCCPTFENAFLRPKIVRLWWKVLGWTKEPETETSNHFLSGKGDTQPHLIPRDLEFAVPHLLHHCNCSFLCISCFYKILRALQARTSQKRTVV